MPAPCMHDAWPQALSHVCTHDSFHGEQTADMRCRLRLHCTQGLVLLQGIGEPVACLLTNVACLLRH